MEEKQMGLELENDDELIENTSLDQDKSFAIAWNENQGGYSEGIAKKVLTFAKNQGLKINTVLDIYCGSGNFLSIMEENGKTCTGTEVLDSYIEYNKQKHRNMNFIKQSSLNDFDKIGKYDLISCNHDVVNYLSSIEEVQQFFTNVYNHLNDGGIFIFDYYTKRKLQYWNEVTYSESDKLDYIKSVTSDGVSKTEIADIYYININPNNKSTTEKEYSISNYDSKFKRTENITIEYFFENQEFVNAIKSSGYRYLITTDANFSPISNISDMNRVHMIAIKREQ
ncbi:MAG: class I SAM-dependent methyltransferase [Clostridia bacterium]|nr:class I SAM-dependent methyltransferase [Clostridia bacterium]